MRLARYRSRLCGVHLSGRASRRGHPNGPNVHEEESLADMATMTREKSDYGAKDIQILEGLEPVR